jgi:hypothetical protein
VTGHGQVPVKRAMIAAGDHAAVQGAEVDVIAG